MNRILNFGSLNIDLVYTLDHIVRPGETLGSIKVETFCGGKGLNQSVALARAGGNVYHAGKIGLDGDILKNVLLENDINCNYLVQTNGKTGHAVIQRELSGQNSIILFGGANKEVTTEQIDGVLSEFDSDDILTCQNEISNVEYLLNAAKKKGMKIALNPSPIDQQLKNYPMDGITWLIINEVEGEELTGKKVPEEITKALLDRYPEIKIVLTLGKHGVVYVDQSSRYTHGIYDVKVADTTAAGDTFLGYFVSTVAGGGDVPTALKNASIASSLAVMKDGAVPSIPTMEQVNRSNLLLK